MNDALNGSLSDLVSLVTEKIASKKDSNKAYVGLEHIAAGGFLVTQIGTAQDSVSANNVFMCGDILFGKLRPQLRKCVQASFDGYCSTDILVLRPKEGVVGDYAFRAAQSDLVFSEAIRTEEGTKMPRTSWAAIRGAKVNIPCLKEQYEISSFLTTADNLIEKTEALIEKYQAIKQGMMHDLFTRGIDAKGQLRPHYEQAPHLYKQTKLGWIPKEWDVSGLREKGSASRAHLKTGPFGSLLKGEHWVESGVPVVTIGALGEGEIVNAELLYVTEKTATRLREYSLEPGDIVFSRVADVGRSAVVSTEQKQWLMSSNLMRISLDSVLANPVFAQMMIAYDARIRQQIRQRVNAGGREVANSDVLNSLKFAWPELSEQHEIVKRTSSLNMLLNECSNEKAKIYLMKNGLMQDLLTGRIRVSMGKETIQL